MKKEQATFGFINYYVFGVLKRLPVQFFENQSDTFAWIDCGRVEERLFSEVGPEMQPEVLGDFSTVMKHYAQESVEMFKNARIWNACVNHEAGIMMLFRVLHEMRIHGKGANDAIADVTRDIIDLRNSETIGIQEIQRMLSDPDFLSKPERTIGVRPQPKVRTDGLFTIA